MTKRTEPYLSEEKKARCWMLKNTKNKFTILRMPTRIHRCCGALIAHKRVEAAETARLHLAAATELPRVTHRNEHGARRWTDLVTNSDLAAGKDPHYTQ